MNDQHLVLVQFKQQVLAAAVGGQDRGVGQPVDDRLTGGAPNRALAPDLDAVDPPTDSKPLESAPDGFDLGKLGHLSLARVSRRSAR